MSSLRHLLAAIREPTLLLDTERVHHNMERMATRARRAGVRLRPHFKTHQSIAVGAWFREAGVEGITVSSLRMAADFRIALARYWKDTFGTEGVLPKGGEPTASNQMISPKQFESFALPYNEKYNLRHLLFY